MLKVDNVVNCIASDDRDPNGIFDSAGLIGFMIYRCDWFIDRHECSIFWIIPTTAVGFPHQLDERGQRGRRRGGQRGGRIRPGRRSEGAETRIGNAAVAPALRQRQGAQHPQRAHRSPPPTAQVPQRFERRTQKVGRIQTHWSLTAAN